MKVRLKVLRSGDARDLGPYFHNIQKLLVIEPETMHEQSGYDA
jgi:hypothetical protein